MKIKILLIVCLSLGFLAGLFAGINYYNASKHENNSEVMRLKGYKFISPLLDYETSDELKTREIIVLKDKIEKLINNKIEENQAIYISVYFRDMLNGPWFGINEKSDFAPASLLKVPLMIAYLKYAEQNPEILKHNLIYEKEIKSDVKQNILPDKKLELGESYSIEDLIVRMIVYSDNIAKDLLLEHIDENILNKVFTDIGIIVPDIRNKTDFITVKDYSSFFRILFNASYLNKDMSEKALKILSESSFKIGLVAGIPANITVAHKFAERGNPANNTLQLHDCGNTLQLHDCGIVYHKERPYLLCVMTYGKDFKELSEIIKDVSSIVYEEVDSYYKKHK